MIFIIKIITFHPFHSILFIFLFTSSIKIQISFIIFTLTNNLFFKILNIEVKFKWLAIRKGIKNKKDRYPFLIIDLK